MKKLFQIGSVFLLMLTCAGRAQDPPGAKEPIKAAPAKPAATRASMTAVLQKPVASIDWDETPFENVIEWVQEQGAVNVVVRWRALEAEGITPDTPISLKLRNATVGQVLTEALDQLAEGSVRFRGLGNTLQVSTRTDFNRKLYTRVYDMSDIVFRIPSFRDAPQIEISDQQGSGGSSGQGGIGTSTGQIFGDADEEEDDNEEGDEVQRQRMQELIELITTTIEPETWQERGGQGSIVGFNQTIVIRNSIEVHELIGGPFELP